MSIWVLFMQLWACEWMVSRNWLLASSWCDPVSLCAWNKQYQYKYTRIGSTVGHEFQIRNINDEKADMQFFWCNFISYKKKHVSKLWKCVCGCPNNSIGHCFGVMWFLWHWQLWSNWRVDEYTEPENRKELVRTILSCVLSHEHSLAHAQRIQI